jgi:7-cyano-7-deazaguanine synthase in queuosine biosynthesis
MEYEFPYIEAEKYSCWFSGGADSSLLLYYLLKSGKPVIVYTTAAISSLHKNAVTSLNVLQKCMELTGNYKVDHIITYSDDKHTKELLENTAPYMVKGISDILYTGITANPPLGTIDLPCNEDAIRNPDKTRSINRNPYAITPFTNFDKKWIAAQYEELGLLETLFPLTNSCEYFGPTGYDPGFHHCGECWWCKERLWAFGRLE